MIQLSLHHLRKLVNARTFLKIKNIYFKNNLQKITFWSSCKNRIDFFTLAQSATKVRFVDIIVIFMVKQISFLEVFQYLFDTDTHGENYHFHS